MYIRFKNGHKVKTDVNIARGVFKYVAKTKSERDEVLAELTEENLSSVALLTDNEEVIATYKAILMGHPVTDGDGVYEVEAKLLYLDDRIAYLEEMRAIQDAAIVDLAEAISNMSEV